MDFSRYSRNLQVLEQKHRDYIRESDKRAVGILKKMLKQAQEMNDLELIGYVYHSLAFVEQFIIGRYSLFLKYLRLSAKYLLRCESEEELSHMYYLIAIDAMNKGLFDIAHHYFLEARSSAEAVNDNTSVAILDQSIAHVLMRLGYYEESRKYNKRSIKVIGKDKNHPHYFSNLLSCYMNEAIACVEIHKLDEAAKAMERVHKYIEKNPSINKGRIKLYYEIVYLRVLVLSRKNSKANELFNTLVETIDNNQQMYLYMDEVEKLCKLLLMKHKEDWVKRIIEAFRKNPMPKDAVEATRMRIEIEIDYYRATNNTKKLLESFREQDECNVLYHELQNKINQYVKALVKLTQELRKERQLAEEEREQFTLMAEVDELTGIPNRHAITMYLDEAFEALYKAKNPLGVVYLDLDDMKIINDTEGHLAGDKHLKEIGTVLARHAKAKGFFAGRFGGDEFVLIFKDARVKQIQRIIDSIREDTDVKFSAGIYVNVPRDKQKSWEYLSGADEKLYLAKAAKNKKKYKIDDILYAKNNSIRLVKDYINITNEIRTLSSPLISDIKDAEEYKKVLMANFTYIAELRKEKIGIMKNYILPLIYNEKPLRKEETALLSDFSRALLDAYSMENIELPVRYHICKKTLDDAKLEGTLRDIIVAQDAMVETTFGMMYIAQRTSPSSNLCYEYRDAGLEISKDLLKHLPKAKFKKLPDEECKHLVLINARYISALFDRSDYCDDEINKQDFDMMKNALALKDDPFYRKEAVTYNWRYHEFRTLQYIADLTHMNNIRGFKKKELREIQKYTKALRKLVESDREYFKKFVKEGMIELVESRNDYLCGDLSYEKYKKILIDIIKKGSMDSYSLHDNSIFLWTFAEYLRIIDKSDSKKDKRFINDAYHNLINYVQRMPKIGSSSFMFTFLADILKEYVDTDDDNDFETVTLKLIGASHPPTYVHSLNVADLSECLTKHLLEKDPERFIGFLDCKDVKDVKAKRKEILHFAYHSALCHDFGKLLVVETIITYGRDLLEEEYEFIRTHPQAGAMLLEKHPKTKPYANIAKYHHVWYNERRGYPENEKFRKLPEKCIIDIVTVADCLDAATDSIGRSFNRGIDLETFIDEIRSDRGTRYAPYVVDLFEDNAVINDIKVILDKGRDKNYREAYAMLSAEEDYLNKSSK